jgi:hypothetical protein
MRFGLEAAGDDSRAGGRLDLDPSAALIAGNVDPRRVIRAAPRLLTLADPTFFAFTKKLTRLPASFRTCSTSISSSRWPSTCDFAESSVCASFLPPSLTLPRG